MPRRYKKRSYRRKKYSGAQSFGRSVGSLASAAYSGVQAIKKLINVEKHKHDNSATVTVNGTTGQVIHLSDIAQGNDMGERTGDSILCQNLFGRIGIVKSSGASSTFLRTMLVRDLQQIADTTPTIAAVLQSASVFSPLNEDNVGRYQILDDHMHVMDSGRGLSSYHKLFQDLSHKHVRYNGAASTDIQKGGLYMLFLSDQGTNLPSLTYNLRLNYTDN